MATDKVFTVCGTSKHPEQGYKVRFANDSLRIKVLTKSKHTDITLIELPEGMSKLAAVQFIKTLDEFSGVGPQSAIADYLDRNDDKPVKATAKSAPGVTKTKAVKATPQVAAIPGTAPLGIKTAKTKAVKVDTSAMEDAPF